MPQFNQLNSDQYNGTYLIDLRGTVIQSHNVANQRAFSSRYRTNNASGERGVLKRIAARLDTVLPKSD